MSILAKKSAEINGKIAALKSLSEKKVVNNKLIKNSKNLIDTLLDIYKKLGGYKEMFESIEDILVKKLDEIEATIKSSIKIALKNIISCSIEPIIGNELIEEGVSFSLRNIDPMNVLTVDPKSTQGQILYFDNDKGINSKDFNVFLYTIIKNAVGNNLNSGSGVWRYKGNSLCKVTYYEYDSTSGKSNIINIKIDSSYNDKKLNTFINDYLDSVKLFNNTQILTSIFGDVLNISAFSLNKTPEQIMSDKMIENLCDKMLNELNEDDSVDSSFFEFSNDTYNSMLEETESKRNGTFKYYGDREFDVTVNEKLLNDSLLNLKNTDSNKISEQTNIIKTTIGDISNELVKSNNINDRDKFSLQMNFIESIIKKLMVKITITLFSPKILYLFVMTSSILNLNPSKDIKEFIKDNINLFKLIITKIRTIITDILIQKIKDMISPMISNVTKRLAKERIDDYKKQLSTLRLF